MNYEKSVAARKAAKELAPKVVEYYKEGHTLTECATKFNIHYTTANNWVSKARCMRTISEARKLARDDR